MRFWRDRPGLGRPLAQVDSSPKSRPFPPHLFLALCVSADSEAQLCIPRAQAIGFVHLSVEAKRHREVRTLKRRGLGWGGG